MSASGAAFARIGSVLSRLCLSDRLLGLVQSNEFMDSMFDDDVNETYNDLETAIRDANITIPTQLLKGLKRSILKEFQSRPATAYTPAQLARLNRCLRFRDTGDCSECHANHHRSACDCSRCQGLKHRHRNTVREHKRKWGTQGTKQEMEEESQDETENIEPNLSIRSLINAAEAHSLDSTDNESNINSNSNSIPQSPSHDLSLMEVDPQTAEVSEEEVDSNPHVQQLLVSRSDTGVGSISLASQRATDEELEQKYDLSVLAGMRPAMKLRCSDVGPNGCF